MKYLLKIKTMNTMDSIEKNKMIKIQIKNQKMPKVLNQKTN